MKEELSDRRKAQTELLFRHIQRNMENGRSSNEYRPIITLNILCIKIISENKLKQAKATQIQNYIQVVTSQDGGRWKYICERT